MPDIAMVQVTADELKAIRPQLQSLIDRQVEYSRGDYTVESIDRDMQSGAFDWWVAWDRAADEVVALFCNTVSFNGQGDPIFLSIWMTGEDGHGAMDLARDAFQAKTRELQLKRHVVMGRKGHAKRALKDYRIAGYIYEWTP